MSRYLVTGGAGFIGSHLAEWLLREGHEVRVLDDLSTGKIENVEFLRTSRLPGRLVWMEGDIRSEEACKAACEGVECVFHQAALASVPRSIANPAATMSVNVVGTVTLMKAAREAGVRRLVQASSSSVYGDTPTLPKVEEMPRSPLSPYAASKAACEDAAVVFSHAMGLETVSLRYFNVFGPRQDPTSQYAAVIPLFITSLIRRKRPTVYGDGHQSRDFTYIDNVVQANWAASQRGPGRGEAVNVACGERYSLLELLGALGEALGVEPDPVFEPARPGDVKHSQAGIERSRALWGFEPKIGFRDGMARTVEFFRRQAG
jgi:UDP-glucose 4-epimerase